MRLVAFQMDVYYFFLSLLSLLESRGNGGGGGRDAISAASQFPSLREGRSTSTPVGAWSVRDSPGFALVGR